jgi:hypothetical protein
MVKHAPWCVVACRIAPFPSCSLHAAGGEFGFEWSGRKFGNHVPRIAKKGNLMLSNGREGSPECH